MTTQLVASQTADRTIVGRDVLRLGRWIRLVVGLVIIGLAATTVHHEGLSGAAIGEETIPAFLGLVAAYTALVRVIGDRLLSRVDGWLAAIVLLAPLAALAPFVSGAVSMGFTLYIGAGILIQALIGYGGCEVAGIPTLLLHRRYRVYCAFNSMDVAEQWLRDRPVAVRIGGMLLAVAATIGVFVALSVIDANRLNGYEIYLLFLIGGYLVNLVTGRHR